MDIAQLLARPHAMNAGDAARYLEGFAAEMASVGYSPLTIGGYLDSVIHFGGWLQARGLSLRGIDERSSGRLEHIAANVLGAAVTQASPAPMAQESNGSSGTSLSKASSDRQLTLLQRLHHL
jgi:hypothetical protein